MIFIVHFYNNSFHQVCHQNLPEAPTAYTHSTHVPLNTWFGCGFVGPEFTLLDFFCVVGASIFPVPVLARS